MPMPTSELPATVARIARLIGREHALRLAGACSTGRLYVPHEPTDRHWISRVVGVDAAREVADAYGGEIIYLAKCRRLGIDHRNRTIRAMHGQGATVAELAEAMGLTVRMVRIVLGGKSQPMDGPAARAKVAHP